MMSAMRRQQTLLFVAMFALLTGCGRSHVVHEASRGSGAPTGERPVKVSEPKYGATLVVRRGQNVYRIATENGLTALDLAIWNDIGSPYTIYPGQRLRLYPGSQTGTAVKPGTPAPRPSAPVPSRTTGTSVVVPTASNVAWRWPADGAVVASFTSGDPTRQGVDIAGKAGQPVHAASDGVVVYSGSGLVGYGELVIVKHDDHWLSAYGHNRARLVNEGQVVKAGQQIAEMGRSGASRDMLHFEIRYNGKPVNPQQYLPKR